MIFEEIIFSNLAVTAIYFFVSFWVLGAGVKYIDDAFDEHTFSKKIAFLLAPILGIFWAYTMSLSLPATTILLAIVIGVFIKGKIDNLAHQIGLVCILAVVFFSGFFEVLWIPLVIITFFGVVDEIGNDFIDEHNVYSKMFPTGKLVHLFFEYRFAMKVAVFTFAFFGFFEYLYFVAFLGFDIGYAMLTKYSEKVSHYRKFSYTGKTINGELSN